MLDLNKPVTTVKRHKVRIISTDRESKFFPIVALVTIADVQNPICYSLEGIPEEKWLDGVNFSLINAPEPKFYVIDIKEMTINGPWKTEKEARNPLSVSTSVRPSQVISVDHLNNITLL